MVFRSAKVVKTTTDAAGLSTTLFPQFIVLPSGGYDTWLDLSAQTAGLAGTYNGVSYTVWHPDTIISIPVGGTPTAMTFGVDYDVLLLEDPTGASKVFKNTIPAPTLTATQNGTTTNYVDLSWDSAFGVKTKVYRTSVYTGTSPSDFTLIAEIDPVLTPGTSATYQDIGLTVAQAATNNMVDYMVINDNGIDTATVTFA